MRRNTFLGLLIVVLLVIVAVRPCQAKIYGTVKGRVIAEDTGKGLAGINVRLFKNRYKDAEKVKTDANGYYQFKNVEPDFYTITFEASRDSGYCSMPVYDQLNNLFIRDKQRAVYKELGLEFTLADGETKTINKALIRGTRVLVKINVDNTDQAFDPNTTFEIRSKKNRYQKEWFSLGSGWEIVLPVGEHVVIVGRLRSDQYRSRDLKEEFEIMDTELQEININLDLATCLELKIIKPPDYTGDKTPNCSLYQYKNGEYDWKSGERFDGYNPVVCSLMPGKYKLRVSLRKNTDTTDINDIDTYEYYTKTIIVEIVAGKNYVTVELE